MSTFEVSDDRAREILAEATRAHRDQNPGTYDRPAIVEIASMAAELLRRRAQDTREPLAELSRTPRRSR